MPNSLQARLAEGTTATASRAILPLDALRVDHLLLPGQLQSRRDNSAVRSLQQARFRCLVQLCSSCLTLSASSRMLLPIANGCGSTVSAGETGDTCVGAQTTSSGVTGADASSAAKRNSSGWVDCFECGLGWCRGLLALFFFSARQRLWQPSFRNVSPSLMMTPDSLNK